MYKTFASKKHPSKSPLWLLIFFLCESIASYFEKKKILKAHIFFSIIFLLTPIIPFPNNLKLLSDWQNSGCRGLKQTIASALARPVIWINNNKSEPSQCDRIPLNNSWSMRVEVTMGKIYWGSRMEIPLIITQKLLVTRCGTLNIGCL